MIFWSIRRNGSFLLKKDRPGEQHDSERQFVGDRRLVKLNATYARHIERTGDLVLVSEFGPRPESQASVAPEVIVGPHMVSESGHSRRFERITKASGLRR